MKKGIGKIILGVGIFASCIILPLAGVFYLVFTQDGGTRLKAPGSVEIKVEDVGTYTLSNNFSTVYQGKSYSDSSKLPDGMTFLLTNKTTGETVPLTSGMNSTMTSGEEKSCSVGSFEVKAPGKYVLTISGNQKPRIFTFSKSFLGRGIMIVFLIIGGFVLSFVGAAVALLLIVMGIINLVKGTQNTQMPHPPPRHPCTDFIEKDY